MEILKSPKHLLILTVYRLYRYFHYCINCLVEKAHRPIYHNYYTAAKTLPTSHLLLRFPIRHPRGREPHVITWIPTSRCCIKSPGRRFEELLLVSPVTRKFNSTASGELCCYVYKLILSFSTDLTPCSGKGVRGIHFPRKSGPTGQDTLSAPGPNVPL